MYMLPQKIFPPFALIQFCIGNLTAFLSYIPFLHSWTARGKTRPYIFRGQIEIIWNSFWWNILIFMHLHFQEIFMKYQWYDIFWILSYNLWFQGKKYVMKTQVHKSSIFKLMILFIRYSFKVAQFMIYDSLILQCFLNWLKLFFKVLALFKQNV